MGAAMGLVNAATAALCDVIAESIESRRWERDEATSVEQWVVWRCGVSPVRARRLVRLARGAGEFPGVWADFRAGQLSEDQLDVIVRGADPAFDADLVGFAGQLHVNQLAKFVRHVCPRPAESEATEAAEDGEAGAERPAQDPVDHLRFGWTDDERFTGRFDLGADAGAIVEKALRSARARLFGERTGKDADADGADHGSVSWADALVRLGHAALGGLDPATARGQRASDRHQALVHLDAEHPERSRIHLGPVLSKSARQLLTCDADIRAVLCKAGRPVALGRRQRVVDPVLRALIEDRDGGCRVPGCGRTGFLHIHHLVHWEDGGETDPSNLIAACTEHHRDIHAGRLRVGGDASDLDGLAFVRAGGDPLPRPEPRVPGFPLPEIPDLYRGLARDARIGWATL